MANKFIELKIAGEQVILVELFDIKLPGLQDYIF